MYWLFCVADQGTVIGTVTVISLPDSTVVAVTLTPPLPEILDEPPEIMLLLSRVAAGVGAGA